MANKVKIPKQGMGGNRHGGRWEKTAVLKEQSKVARRRTNQSAALEDLASEVSNDALMNPEAIQIQEP